MRLLDGMNTHGVKGEFVDDNIRLEVDGQFKGTFKPSGRVYAFHPTTMARLDLNTLNRIRGALEKANKARYRETV